MNEELKLLIENVRSSKINCSYGLCSLCPYYSFDNYCKEYVLADCCRVLLSDIPRDNPIIELINDILLLY